MKIEDKFNPVIQEVKHFNREQGLSEIINDIKNLPFKSMTLKLQVWSESDAQNLENLKNVRHLNMSNTFNNMQDEFAIYEHIIENILNMTRLESLSLSNNAWMLKSLINQIKSGLENLENLTYLNLSNNNLEDDNIERLNITKLKKLKTLDLRANDLTAKKIKILKKALPGTQIVTEEYISAEMPLNPPSDHNGHPEGMPD